MERSFPPQQTRSNLESHGSHIIETDVHKYFVRTADEWTASTVFYQLITGTRTGAQTLIRSKDDRLPSIDAYKKHYANNLRVIKALYNRQNTESKFIYRFYELMGDPDPDTRKTAIEISRVRVKSGTEWRILSHHSHKLPVSQISLIRFFFFFFFVVDFGERNGDIG
jgi:hypothetical protein